MFTWRMGRKRRLAEKYGESDAERMARGELWRGMTTEMVEATLGKPQTVEADSRGLWIWKYKRLGKTIRLTFKNGIVARYEVNWPSLRDLVRQHANLQVCAKCNKYYFIKRPDSGFCLACRRPSLHGTVIGCIGGLAIGLMFEHDIPQAGQIAIAVAAAVGTLGLVLWVWVIRK